MRWLSLLVAVVFLWWWTGRGPVQQEPALSALSLLSVADSAGFLKADHPRAFQFPEDHGPHAGFRHEWWYLTGNLKAGSRLLGYQFTVFRFSLAPPAAHSSPWRNNDLYMSHLALTDGQSKRYYHGERFSRPALGMAGAQGSPFRVWLGSWALQEQKGGQWHLMAHEGTFSLDLTLTPDGPPILQGEEGWSQKGGQPGNASYYYSFTRLPTRGRVRLGEETLEVTGNSWFDREWGSGSLEPGQVGWDWFALQLEDGHDLMYYRLRRGDGSADPFSRGVLVAEGQGIRSFSALSIEETGRWQSPISGVVYPAGWRVQGEGFDLDVQPLIPDQEINGAVRYWEGAVVVSGSRQGRGYVELVGYGRR